MRHYFAVINKTGKPATLRVRPMELFYAQAQPMTLTLADGGMWQGCLELPPSFSWRERWVSVVPAPKAYGGG